jgi:hypothetical protein
LYHRALDKPTPRVRGSPPLLHGAPCAPFHCRTRTPVSALAAANRLDRGNPSLPGDRRRTEDASRESSQRNWPSRLLLTRLDRKSQPVFVPTCRFFEIDRLCRSRSRANLGLMQQIGEKRVLYKIRDSLRGGLITQSAGKTIFVGGWDPVDVCQTNVGTGFCETKPVYLDKRSQRTSRLEEINLGTRFCETNPACLDKRSQRTSSLEEINTGTHFCETNPACLDKRSQRTSRLE